MRGTGDGGRLELRERVAIRVQRVAQAAETQIDHAGFVQDHPADRLRLRLDVDHVPANDHLRDEQLGRRGHPGDPGGVVHRGRDQPGHERAVSFEVDHRRAADETLRLDDLVRELGMGRDVDTRVDDGDPDRLQILRRGIPVVERPCSTEVPLLDGQRVVRDVREPARAEPLDVRGARKCLPARRNRPLDDQRRNGSETLRVWQGGPKEWEVRGRPHADGIARGIGGGREERRRDDHQREALHRSSICAESPSANPCTGATRTR